MTDGRAFLWCKHNSNIPRPKPYNHFLQSKSKLPGTVDKPSRTRPGWASSLVLHLSLLRTAQHARLSAPQGLCTCGASSWNTLPTTSHSSACPGPTYLCGLCGCFLGLSPTLRSLLSAPQLLCLFGPRTLDAGAIAGAIPIMQPWASLFTELQWSVL